MAKKRIQDVVGDDSIIFTGQNHEEVDEFVGDQNTWSHTKTPELLELDTPAGVQTLEAGDVVVRGAEFCSKQ